MNLLLHYLWFYNKYKNINVNELKQIYEYINKTYTRYYNIIIVSSNYYNFRMIIDNEYYKIT